MPYYAKVESLSMLTLPFRSGISILQLLKLILTSVKMLYLKDKTIQLAMEAPSAASAISALKLGNFWMLHKAWYIWS